MTRRSRTDRAGTGRGWGDMPSSSDLARLVLCETELVAEKNSGRVRTDAASVAASKRGVRAHAQAQAQMETFHNRPRPTRTTPPSQAAPPSARDSRCFIASSVYGPEAPQTEELRAFRDRSLMRSALGRAFVRCYYRLSPPVAASLERHPRLAAPVRTGLDVLRRIALRPGPPGEVPSAPPVPSKTN